MKNISLIGAGLILMTSAAIAQTQPSTNVQPPAPSTVQPSAGTQPPASQGPGNKAINTDKTNNPGAPVAGANSFTEGQAKARIEDKGFTGVSGLKKDDEGVWRGTAMKDGKSVAVSVDFQGNVVAR
jgi:hypothetical protein